MSDVCNCKCCRIWIKEYEALRQSQAPMPSREDIAGAIARAWCTDRNSKKEMDAYLAMDATDEIMKLLTQNMRPETKELSRREILKLAEKECRAEHCQHAFMKGFREAERYWGKK